LSQVLGVLGINWPLFISQLVNFVLLMFILRAFLYKPVLGMLEQRRERIAQSMKEAERASLAAREAEQEKAKILDAARRDAQEIRAQATRDTEKIAQDIRARAEQEATEIRMKSQSDAKAQVESALSDANKQIADLAIAATEKLLGRELSNKDEQQRLVEEFVAQNANARSAAR
jgi:F-type H+-transporting ATPase subunit b